MNEADTATILHSDVLTANDDGMSLKGSDHPEESDEPSTCCTGSTFFNVRCPLVTVEPVVFFTMFSVTMQVPLTAEYLWDRISQDIGYNISRTSECSNKSFPPDPLQKEVDTMIAQWNLYLNVAVFSASLLVVCLLGSWSDQAGRRPVLILPNLGLALQAAIYLLVMYLKLPVAYLLIGKIISGLSGDFVLALGACFSYVADISDRKSRTIRIATLEASLGISGMLASIIGGYWKQAQGYIKPYWMVLAANLTSILYVYLFVHETVVPDPSAKLFTLRHYKAVWRLLSAGGRTSEESGRSYLSKMWLYILSYFLAILVNIGCIQMYTMYELSSPLCWGPILIGYGLAFLNLESLISVLGLKVLQHCLEESWVAVLGLVSNIAGLLAFSLADTTALMFTGYALLFLFNTVKPVLSSKLSKLVSPSEQGALFSIVGFVETLSYLAASGIFNSIYSATLHFMKGFTFVFAAILLLIPGAIIVSLRCLDQRRNHRGTTDP